MRQFGVFAALTLTWITASCAERIVHPAVISQPTPPKAAASRPIPNNVEVRRQAETIAENAGKSSAIRSRQTTPRASLKPEPPPVPQAPLPQVSLHPKKTSTSHEPPVAVALPPPPEPDESNFPFAVLMPPPPVPAEPTFPSVSSTVELPPSLEPAVPILPEVTIEAALPPPPETAEPSFPVAALIPPPSERSLPSQEEAIIESPIPIPFPDLASNLSLRPQFDWVDTVGSIEVPHSPLSDAREASPEEGIPSLIRNPWPLSMEGS
jgi:hypothetical protein